MFNIINYTIFGLYAAFIVFESLRPERSFPSVSFWRLRGLVSAIAYIALASYSPYLWASWLGGDRPFLNAGEMPIWLQAALGYAAIQFFAYWWHRAMHKSDFLWRTFHQMHHSVERMDGWGALYHHPLDVIGFTFMGSFALMIVIGIDPLAGAIAGIVGATAVFFTHANMKTPRFIGWVFQRPEGHGRHHERGRHAGNYAELVVWDAIFGTYENPKEWHGEAGFYDGASARVLDMLIFKDVSTPPKERASRRTDPQNIPAE